MHGPAPIMWPCPLGYSRVDVRHRSSVSSLIHQVSLFFKFLFLSLNTQSLVSHPIVVFELPALLSTILSLFSLCSPSAVHAHRSWFPFTYTVSWFVHHVRASSGILFFGSLDWDPARDAQLTIYCDACLEGMGFWIPELRLGFYAPISGEAHRDRIFYWEAMCVLASLEWFVGSDRCRRPPLPDAPSRLVTYTDNTNTVNIFNTLHALPEYNDILKSSVNTRIADSVDWRVLHVAGDDNGVADALSRHNLDRAMELAPGLVVNTFQTPRLALGVEGC